MDITAEDDILGLCNQNSSHEHVSDFGQLQSYVLLKLRTDSKVYWNKWHNKLNKHDAENIGKYKFDLTSWNCLQFTQTYVLSRFS